MACPRMKGSDEGRYPIPGLGHGALDASAVVALDHEPLLVHIPGGVLLGVPMVGAGNHPGVLQDHPVGRDREAPEVKEPKLVLGGALVIVLQRLARDEGVGEERAVELIEGWGIPSK